jgi:hypothetical protein
LIKQTELIPHEQYFIDYSLLEDGCLFRSIFSTHVGARSLALNKIGRVFLNVVLLALEIHGSILRPHLDSNICSVLPFGDFEQLLLAGVNFH